MALRPFGIVQREPPSIVKSNVSPVCQFVPSSEQNEGVRSLSVDEHFVAATERTDVRIELSPGPVSRIVDPRLVQALDAVPPPEQDESVRLRAIGHHRARHWLG